LTDELIDTRNCYQGWSADKQRMFLRQLAATGSVTRAAEAVGMTARSAYYLRNRPEMKVFREAWMGALRAAADTLVALAFERAVTGTRQKYWQDGKLVGERLVPSDRMLTWLLARVAPPFPTRELGHRHTVAEDFQRSLEALPDYHPNMHDRAELERLAAQAAETGSEAQPENHLQPQVPHQPTALPAPAPAPGPARPHARKRTRTHESA
jgi:hypothetical protein